MTDEPGDDIRRLLRDSVRGFVAKNSDMRRVRESRAQEPGFDRAVWTIMARSGWLGLLHDEAAGGLGMGFAEASVLCEEFGRALLPEPVVAAAVLAAGCLRGCESTEPGDTLLRAVIAGTTLPALAWQECNRNYDPDAVQTHAAACDDGVRLSGTKRFVPAAAGSDGFLVTAAAAEGTGLYWVERDAAGLGIMLQRSVDGVAQATLRLDGVAVPARHVVRPACAGDALRRAIDEARLCACAEMLGVMSRALELTLDYVRQREQFGRSIGSFQAIQHRLVDLFIQQELARNTLSRAVAVFDTTQDPLRRAVAVSAAKARASDAGLLITRQAIQLHGGIGFTDECDIGLYLKRALALAAWLGNASVHRARFDQVSGRAP